MQFSRVAQGVRQWVIAAPEFLLSFIFMKLQIDISSGQEYHLIILKGTWVVEWAQAVEYPVAYQYG